jgi:VanZ family protein
MTDVSSRWWRNPRLSRVVLGSYWVALAVATHLPPGLHPATPNQFDKLEHFVCFAILAWLLAMAWQRSTGRLTGSHLRAAWFAIAVYAAVDEGTQPLVGRTCSAADWLADVLGAAVGLFIFAWMSRRQRKESP